MGLDMYMSAEKYLSEYNESEKAASDQITEILESPGRVNHVVAEIGYWRKANHIHHWFVKNVQDGEDDCGRYWVDRDKLRELRDACREVLKVARLVPGKLHTSTSFKGDQMIENYEDGFVIENAGDVAEILPTGSGFFFGSTDYDEWYLKSVERTLKIVEDALKIEGWDIYYSSSW